MAWRFTPRWYSVLVTAVALPLFISLGSWQWNRGQARQAQWDEFARGDAPAVEASATSLPQLPRYARVRLSGEPDGQRQFLLENISHQGAPGYYVLTVLRLAEGSRLLVNRGWVPFTGFREQLPDLRLPQGEPVAWTVTGRIGALPVAGLAAGQVGPPLTGTWPRVASFPTLAQLEAAYGAPLLPVVLLLDDGATPGYLRDWTPSGLPPERHVGYAVQWWALAVLLAGLFIGVNLKKRDD